MNSAVNITESYYEHTINFSAWEFNCQRTPMVMGVSIGALFVALFIESMLIGVLLLWLPTFEKYLIKEVYKPKLRWWIVIIYSLMLLTDIALFSSNCFARYELLDIADILFTIPVAMVIMHRTLTLESKMFPWSKYLKYIQIVLLFLSFISVGVHCVLEWFHYYGWYGNVLLLVHNGTLVVASALIYACLLYYIHLTQGTMFHNFGVIDIGLICDILAYGYDFTINLLFEEHDMEITSYKIMLITFGLVLNLLANSLLMFHYVYGLNLFCAICIISSRSNSTNNTNTGNNSRYGAKYKTVSSSVRSSVDTTDASV